MALSAFGSWGYFHKSLTLELKENSTLKQCSISVLRHPPKIRCDVFKLWALFEYSSTEHYNMTLDRLLDIFFALVFSSLWWDSCWHFDS